MPFRGCTVQTFSLQVLLSPPCTAEQGQELLAEPEWKKFPLQAKGESSEHVTSLHSHWRSSSAFPLCWLGRSRGKALDICCPPQWMVCVDPQPVSSNAVPLGAKEVGWFTQLWNKNFRDNQSRTSLALLKRRSSSVVLRSVELKF